MGGLLKCFSVKNLKTATLMKYTKKITAICKNEIQGSVLSYGCENGLVKDFDIRSKSQVRSANLHQGSKVTCITHKGKYLISASEDGRVIIYDYMLHVEYRELTLGSIIKKPISSLLLMDNEKLLVIGDQSGLTPIDIQSTKQAEPCSAVGAISSMIKVSATDNFGKGVFAVAFANGQLTLYRE